MVKAEVLSENEREVLYGQVRYPLLNDRELSERIDFKMSTLTAIKNRLKEKGVLSKVRIPVFHRLGCEIFQISFGGFSSDPLAPDPVELLDKTERDSPRTYYSFQSYYKYLFFNVYRNFSEAKRLMTSYQRKCYKEDCRISKDNRRIRFSRDLMDSLILFDYETVLGKAFNIERKKTGSEDLDAKSEEFGVMGLKKMEKRVLWGLVAYPTLPDTRVSEKIGASRQAVSRSRKEFERAGLIKTVKVPSLPSLGYGLMGLFHIPLDPRASSSARKSGLKKIRDRSAPVILFSDNKDIFSLSFFKDYNVYQECRGEIFQHYIEEGLFDGHPRTMGFSLTAADDSGATRFSGVAKDILGV